MIKTLIDNVKRLECVSYKYFIIENKETNKIIYHSPHSFFQLRDTINHYETLQDFFLDSVDSTELQFLSELDKKISIFKQTDYYTDKCSFALDIKLSEQLMKETYAHLEIISLPYEEYASQMDVYILSISTKGAHKQLIAHNKNVDYFFCYTENQWQRMEKKKLTQEEVLTIKLGIQGYNIEDIAHKTHKSIPTIKRYRKQLIEKFDVNGILEANNHYINYHYLYTIIPS